jgi:AcrR family transcriptional regulator
VTGTATDDPGPAPAERAPQAQARPSLRDRKKEQNRRAIQLQAVRLIERQGYAATTVEQIADAANVSTSTFFRYYRNKDDAVLADLLAETTTGLAAEAPAEITPVQTLKHVLCAQYRAMSDEEWDRERRRTLLVLSVPELQGALFAELVRPLHGLRTFVAERLGQPEGTPEVNVYAGAVFGALMGVVLPTSNAADVVLPVTRQDVIDLLTRIFDLLDSMLVAPASS